MLRLILLLLALAAPAWGQPPPLAPPLHPSENFPYQGVALARGALVWLHGTYDPAAGGPPHEPDIVGHFATDGFDIWRFDRARGSDRLDSGGEALLRGLAALRQAGYRRMLVAGHSRGGWIALRALAVAGAADGVLAVSPAAFGTRPERQAEAMADWQRMWDAAAPAATRIVLVQLRGDPYDPDPARRREIAEAESARAGLRLLSIFLPPEPTGHIGVYMPPFDERLGQQIVHFLAPQ
jgi:pimeloyl-ACP methyl ester carboxylesterase